MCECRGVYVRRLGVWRKGVSIFYCVVLGALGCIVCVSVWVGALSFCRVVAWLQCVCVCGFVLSLCLIVAWSLCRSVALSLCRFVALSLTPPKDGFVHARRRRFQGGGGSRVV